MKSTISIAVVALGLVLHSTAMANEQSIIDRIEAQRTKKANQKQREELARYEAHRRRWRLFPCPEIKRSDLVRPLDRYLCTPMEYDWQGWTRNGTIYTTERQEETRPPSNVFRLRGWDGGPRKISVDCRILKVKTHLSADDVRIGFPPNKWRLPDRGSETAMVAARCAPSK